MTNVQEWHMPDPPNPPEPAEPEEHYLDFCECGHSRYDHKAAFSDCCSCNCKGFQLYGWV